MIFPKSLIQKISDQPKIIFLIDGVGALVSAIFLGVILIQLKAIIGMPEDILIPLALIALVFAGYSLGNAFRMQKEWKRYLRIIAIANLLYCLLTLGLVTYHFSFLGTLGLIYFILEILIIIVLVKLEWEILKS